jgi:hypothetical protein
VTPGPNPIQDTDWLESTEGHAVKWAPPANAAIARAEKAIADLAMSLGDAVGTQANTIA